jgi:hypothetical protein
MFVRALHKYTRLSRRRDRLEIRRMPEDSRVFRLTPALERAGYRVPGDVLVREGYSYKRTRAGDCGARIMTWNFDMKAAPRDATLLLLLIAPDDDIRNALEDTAGYSRTVGFNNFDNDDEDKWVFAGWMWDNDCFVDGSGNPVAWMLFPAVPAEVVTKL